MDSKQKKAAAKIAQQLNKYRKRPGASRAMKSCVMHDWEALESRCENCNEPRCKYVYADLRTGSTRCKNAATKTGYCFAHFDKASMAEYTEYLKRG